MPWDRKPVAVIDTMGYLWCVDCAADFSKTGVVLRHGDTGSNEPCDGCGTAPPPDKEMIKVDFHA